MDPSSSVDSVAQGGHAWAAVRWATPRQRCGRVDTHGQTVSATRFSELTGVSRERLRTWERRHGFPEPVRIGSGPRRYAIADAARVVAVRHAAAAGVPLPEAIAAARGAAPPDAPPEAAFRATVDGAPVPVALISGPEPLRLVWTNAALRAIEGAPAPGEILPAIAGAPHRRDHPRALRQRRCRAPRSSTRRGAAASPARAARRSRHARSSTALPTAPGETPLVAIVGVETRGEHEARTALATAEAELAQPAPARRAPRPLARRARRAGRRVPARARARRRRLGPGHPDPPDRRGRRRPRLLRQRAARAARHAPRRAGGDRADRRGATRRSAARCATSTARGWTSRRRARSASLRDCTRSACRSRSPARCSA